MSVDEKLTFVSRMLDEQPSSVLIPPQRQSYIEDANEKMGCGVERKFIPLDAPCSQPTVLR